MSIEKDRESLISNFLETKARIASLLLRNIEGGDATREDILQIRLELEKSMDDLGLIEKQYKSSESSFGISRFKWDNLLVVWLKERIEKELKKPLNSLRARQVFAYTIWLSVELLFKEDLRLVSRQEDFFYRANRANRITAYILSLNDSFQKLENDNDVCLFKTDLPSLFVKLPTICQNSCDDFSVKVGRLTCVFEPAISRLRKLVRTNTEGLKSIDIIHEWLRVSEIPSVVDIVETWKKIVRVRAEAIHSESLGTRADSVLEFFGQSEPPVDYSKLWDSVLDKFLESLERLQVVISLKKDSTTPLA